jgi:hypothetical protein
MRSRIPLMVLLLSQLASAAANRVPVNKLLDQMIHRSTLAEPGGRPFYLKATITDRTIRSLSSTERSRNIGCRRRNGVG